MLATTQIALSMLLLVLAALFTQSLANVARVDLGLRTESIVTFMVSPSLSGYSAERQAQMLGRDRTRVQGAAGRDARCYSTIALSLFSGPRVGHAARRRRVRAGAERRLASST